MKKFAIVIAILPFISTPSFAEFNSDCVSTYISAREFGSQPICRIDAANKARVGSPHVRMRPKDDKSDICLTSTSGFYIENPYLHIVDCKDGRCKQVGSIETRATDANGNATEVCAVFRTWTKSGLWSGGNWGSATMCGTVTKPVTPQVFQEALDICASQ